MTSVDAYVRCKFQQWHLSFLSGTVLLLKAFQGKYWSFLTWSGVITLKIAWPFLSFLVHREKFLFWARLARKLAFWFCSHSCETSVRRNTSEASLLSDDAVLKWAGTLDYCVCECFCAMHSTSLSWSSPHPFPSLPSFYILTSFKALLIVLHCKKYPSLAV